MIQETYNLVPAPHMLLARWTSSKTEPWSGFLVARVVRQSSVRFGRSKRLNCLSEFAANQAEGLVFGKPIESGSLAESGPKYGGISSQERLKQVNG